MCGAGLQRATAAEQHADECARQRDQAHGSSLVDRRHEGGGGNTATDIDNGLPRRNPRDGAASTSPWRVASSSRIRRPAKEVAVITTPIRMPATGTTATPSSGTVPLASTIAVTGNAPPATASPALRTRFPLAADRSGRPVARPAAVTAATASMSATNATAPASEDTNASSSTETAASCSVARTAATRIGRCCPAPTAGRPPRLPRPE
jgi:hypothetical protein